MPDLLVEMEDLNFNPKVVVIRAGTTVKFANKDEALHTATSDAGLWDSGNQAKVGSSFSPSPSPVYIPATASATAALGIVAGSLIINRFWCGYLCPLGGVISIQGRLKLLRIRRDEVGWWSLATRSNPDLTLTWREGMSPLR